MKVEPTLVPSKIDDIKDNNDALIGYEYIYSIRYTAFIRTVSGFRITWWRDHSEIHQLIADRKYSITWANIRLIVYDPLNKSRQVFDAL